MNNYNPNIPWQVEGHEVEQVHREPAVDVGRTDASILIPWLIAAVLVVTFIGCTKWAKRLLKKDHPEWSDSKCTKVAAAQVGCGMIVGATVTHLVNKGK